jgi:deoxycytidylate deaminase
MAEKSTSRFRLGAVLAKKNRVLSTGFNDMRKTHTIMQKYNLDKSWAPGLHAEVHACLGMSMSDIEGSDLYVVRILKDSHLAMAKPCRVCHKFILDVGIRRVYYSFSDEGWNELERS